MCCAVVQTGSETLNHAKLMTLYSLFTQWHSGSRRFGRVEPPKTHVKLHHRTGSPCGTVVRTGVQALNS